jgi:hypothetical protein
MVIDFLVNCCLQVVRKQYIDNYKKADQMLKKSNHKLFNSNNCYLHMVCCTLDILQIWFVNLYIYVPITLYISVIFLHSTQNTALYPLPKHYLLWGY